MGQQGQWTVKHHLANARSKVGAVTTAQLASILAPP
jgi:DNA-binding CsgD family transcriptional regulator